MDAAICTVGRTDHREPLSAEFHDGPWSSVAPVGLTHFMGELPEHRPDVSVKLLYDDSGLYVSYLVEDRYVLATALRHQDSVCIDSCVEFFFTPGERLEDGYFNVEVNCGGTVLLNHQTAREKDLRVISSDVIDRMDVRHSLPSRVVPEIEQPVSWSVRYRLGFDDIERFAPVDRPGPGVVWRGNFYKCADKSSHPHWLTWAPVDLPKPDFHQQGFFGRIVFA